MKYDEELLEHLGSVGEYEVVDYQPHLRRDMTCIGLDTPDGRRHDLDEDEAAELVDLLTRARPSLLAARDEAARTAREVAEEE
jgi:hypothetical protein